MKNKLITLLVALNSLAYAQVSGYMGKRAVVEYNNYFFPAFIGPGYLSTNNDLFSFGFNSTHCLNLDYAVGSRTNICISGQYLHTGIKYKKASNSYDYDFNYSDDGNRYKYNGNFSTPIQLQSINAGIGFKFFGRNATAPLGFYSKLELLIMFETVTYDYENFLLDDYNSTYNTNGIKANYGKGKYNYTNFAINFSLGKQKIIFNHIVFNYGGRIGLTPLAALSFLASDEGFRNTPEYTFKDQARYRLFRQQLLNAYIGIGFLPF
jgi:hypothetical protein